jgi:hypothetical protein
MDDLPTGPMLALVALLILWSGLFSAVEAAHHILLAKRTARAQATNRWRN